LRRSALQASKLETQFIIKQALRAIKTIQRIFTNTNNNLFRVFRVFRCSYNILEILSVASLGESAARLRSSKKYFAVP